MISYQANPRPKKTRSLRQTRISACDSRGREGLRWRRFIFMRKRGPWREEELLSESAESLPGGDTVIFLTLLFVYGLWSRSAEISRSVGAPGQGAGSEEARWEGLSCRLGAFTRWAQRIQTARTRLYENSATCEDPDHGTQAKPIYQSER